MAEKTFMTMEGNEACAYMAYPFTEVAAIYPISLSSPMATLTDRWSAQGRKNMFGQIDGELHLVAGSDADDTGPVQNRG